MQQNKLLRLLSVFSTEDLHRFRAFIESPFFNTNSNVSALYRYIFAFAPIFDDSRLSVDVAYAAIFPNELERIDKKAVIIKLSSKLLALAEQYLEHEVLKQEKFIGATFRKRWFRLHGQSDWEAIALGDMEYANRTRPFQDENYAQNRYLIEYERAKWESSAHSIAEKLDLSPLNFTLDEYYLRAKLECLCHIANHGLVSNRQYETPEMELVIGLVAIREHSLMPVTSLWFRALKLLQTPNDKLLFADLKTALQAQERLLSTVEKQTFFVFLTNTARQTFPAPNDYFAELFALYQFQLETGSLLTNGVIAPEAFFNVLSVALRQKENDWAFQFVNQYDNRLDPSSDKKEDMLALCKSMVAIALGQHTNALGYLNMTHFKDVQSKMAERRMRLKIYLELGYEDLFLDQTKSFRKFLSVNKDLVPPHHAEGNLNFITAILSFFRLKTGQVAQFETLQKILAKTAVLPEKNWLEEKLHEFADRKKK